MVRSKDDGLVSVAPFLKKCFEMVDDESTDSIISWSQSSDSFVIWDMTEFSVQLLPKYFKHSNSSSFIRQLNIYGFRKVDTDHWEFANDGFIRGQKHLLKNISRRKNPQSTENRKPLKQQDNISEANEKAEDAGLWKEVENLKSDKNVMTQELVKLRQHQETADNKLLLLRDRLQGMENNQQQMLSFLVMVVQNPSFLIQLLQSKETNWRMAEPGIIIEQDSDDAEPLPSDGMIIKYQPASAQIPEPVHGSPMDVEKPQPQESSPPSDVMKDFFMSPDFMKVLMDENLSFENHASFVFPELSDDGTWEQLLLANPFSENTDPNILDKHGSTDADTEVGTAVSEAKLDRSLDFELLVEQREHSENLESKRTRQAVHMDKSDSMEIITKQMCLLASDTNQK